MTAREALEKILPMYGEFYTVVRDEAAAPFLAEAECVVNDEEYTAYRTVKISEVVSRELVFFTAVESLGEAQALSLAEAAWEEGLSRVQPGPTHRNTDIVLVLLADTLSPEAARALKKFHRVKNYKLTFHGWSVLRVVAIETSSGNLTFNRMGQSLKKLFSNIKF